MQAATVVPPPTSARRTIGKIGITSGVVARRLRMFIYGPAGAGKTTFASSFPKPIVICGEDGSNELDVSRVTFDEAGRVVPKAWAEVIDAVETLTHERHDFETLVLDGADSIDELARAVVLRANPKWKSISDPGFGKGESAVLDVWRGLVMRLEEAWKKMNVVIVGHAKVKRFDNPEGLPYDRYQPSITDHPQGNVAGFLQGWVDVQAFAKFEVNTYTENKRTIGVGTGARVLHLQRMPAWEAKCRPRGMPAEIPLSYDDFAHALREGQSPVALRAELERLLPSVDEKTRETVRAWLETEDAKNVVKLAVAVDRLRAKAMTTTEEVSS
jgi:hypothetical protein